MKYYMFVVGLLIFASCQQKVEYAGKKIDHIQFDRIILEDGSPYIFEKTDSTKIYYLVRHAEKDTAKNDPILTNAGNARAEKLESIFKKTRLDVVYSTLTSRTIMTAEDLVASKGIKILPYDAKDLEKFAKHLTNEEKGRSILVVGHSNTTTELFTLLSEKESPVTIGEMDYGYLFIIVMNGSVLTDAFHLTY